MQRRYQIFVSSTFTDLEDERQGIMRTLMELDCIPAGMELFPAADEEQWAFIQKVIDDCDYYLLIIGGRYGSLATDGLSYTEKEFDYAVSKGIHVIALIHGEPQQLSVAKSDIEKEAVRLLEAFRQKVRTGRLVKSWKSPPELLQQVVLSLTHAFKAYPREGWVRGGATSNISLLEQINELRKRNERLQKEIAQVKVERPPAIDVKLADTESHFEVHGTFISRGQRQMWTYALTWNQIVSILGPHLLSPQAQSNVNRVFASAVRSYAGSDDANQSSTDIAVLDTIKVQLLALGYIDLKGGSWILTNAGKQVMFRTRTLKAAI